MQFTLKTLLLLFVVFATSIAAFGPVGIAVTGVVVLVGLALDEVICTLRDPKIRWQLAIGIVVVLFVVFLFLLPAMQMKGRGIPLTVNCICNLKGNGFAFYNYHNDYGSFPPAYVTDNNGNRMHSWRMLVLPYLEGQTLHQQYDFHEPWNGPNNVKLQGAQVDEFQCSSVPHGANPTVANYVAVVGSRTAWPGDRGRKLDEFTDGLDKTLLLIEWANSDIHWMEPRDVTVGEVLSEPGEPIRLPESPHSTKRSYLYKSLPLAGNVMFADGLVHQIPKEMKSKDFAKLLFIDDGEPVDVDQLLAKYEPPIIAQLRWDHIVGLPLFIISTIWFWLRMLADAKMTRAAREEQPLGEDDS